MQQERRPTFPILKRENLNVDVLYELARYLVGNEPQTEELILTALRIRNSDSSAGDLRVAIVRAYLAKSRSTLDRSNQLMGHGSKDCGLTSTQFEVELDQLNPEERVCLVLRERLGLSVPEIAQITGLGRERTQEALLNARERLRLLSRSLTKKVPGPTNMGNGAKGAPKGFPK